MSSAARVYAASMMSAFALLATAVLARTGADSSLVLGSIALSFVPYAFLLSARAEHWESVSTPVIWIAFAVASLGFVGVAPMLSTDVYRYLADGRTLLAGLNPICIVPDSVIQASPFDLAQPLVNHSTLSSPYPIGAQVLFAIIVGLGGSLAVMQLLTVAIHALTAVVLLRLAPGHRPSAAFAYALNPLLIVESAWSAHIDFVVGLLLLLGVVWCARNRDHRAAISWSLAASVKLAGLIPLFWLACQRRKHFAWLVAAVALIAMPYAFCTNLHSSQQGLMQYAERWSGHNVLFPVLEHSLGNVLSWTHQTGRFTAGVATRLLVVLLLGAWVVYLSRRQVEPWLAVRSAIFALLLLSPQFHPWYIAWLLPLEAARGRRAGFVLSAAMLGTYLPLADWNAARIWQDSALFLWISSTIVYITIILERQDSLRFAEDAAA